MKRILTTTKKNKTHLLINHITKSSHQFYKFLLFLHCYLFVISSLTNAQEVAPLKKGNFWVYITFPREIMVTVVDTNTVIDTLSYYHLTIDHQSPHWVSHHYIRLRDDDYYAVRLDTSFPAPNHEKLYYKKNAVIGDEWINSTDFLPMYYSIIDTFVAPVFGQSVTIKVLEIDGGVVFFTEFWTEEFGKLNRVDTGDLQYALRGCMINSIAYGDTSFVVGIEHEDLPLSSFNLDQNYPNPFNPSTTINYWIPTEGNVQLKIYNSLGEVVDELVNEWQRRGKYSFEYNASDLSNGVYFYRLYYQDRLLTKKMVLLK